jgi:hypothetical protein
VVLDSTLSFIPHITSICKDALTMLGFLKTNGTNAFKNIDCLKLLFTTFIRSKPEYCCLIWSPYYDTHIAALEKIQRKFCKYLYFVKHGHYPVLTRLPLYCATHRI